MSWLVLHGEAELEASAAATVHIQGAANLADQRMNQAETERLGAAQIESPRSSVR
jgi:hypothetical protein